MNNIEEAFKKSDNFSDFSLKYFKYISEIQNKIDLDELIRFESEFVSARQNGNTIFVAGNGGSAPLRLQWLMILVLILSKLVQKPFKVFALTDNSSVVTAISNDVGYENIFINQLRIHYRPGDKLIVISASGNSENIVKAAKWVKSKNGKVLGMLGFKGGELRGICDTSILIPSIQGEYGPVEDMHLMINHLLAHWFQNKLK